MAPGSLCCGDLQLNTAARVVRRRGATLDVPSIEFALLAALLRAAGRVVAREELTREVLQRKLLPFDRSLDMHMCNLRRKLGPGAQQAERIKTLRGIGYIYVKVEE